MLNKYSWSMIVGALAIGLSPIVTKLSTLPPSTIALYRFSFGTLSLLAYILYLRPKIDFNNLKMLIIPTMIGGLCFSIDLWFWHQSIKTIGAGVSTLLANTQVFYLVIIGIVFFKEKPNLKFFLGLVLTVIGILLTVYPLISVTSLYESKQGVIFGLLTGLSYSIVTLNLKKATQINTMKAPIPIFLVTFFAMIFTFLITKAEGNFQIAQDRELFYMFIYGAIIHVFGWVLISKVINLLPISLTSLILLLQPIFATILGILIFKEYVNFYQAMGLILSLIGIYISTRFQKART